jgi:outer membrane receptor protein involved in Fe transport
MIIRNRKNQNGRAEYNGNISFNITGNPNTTGYALADALTGNFNTYTEAQYDPMGYYRYTEPSAFIDDTWKVSRKLSLNLGLRYEYFMTMYSLIDNLTNFVPSLYNPAQAVKINSKGQIVPGSGNIYNGLQRVANGIPSQYKFGAERRRSLRSRTERLEVCIPITPPGLHASALLTLWTIKLFFAAASGFSMIGFKGILPFTL